ncbi:CsbD family protein [Marinobacterium lutimaris]|uniref:Uncharacterized conserved protein YjbJ, UPF0337 family n=1 Tax=Marinobacterium lutimaris TaxID=568106 RepID=A0A1H5UCC8_9GAMM|nr:CsbD family protein [Marinobacterium lutimaris]SEF72654.1 Uncharacterized conserved protein YjbJ, UPF0337 family [Marinobacterium lutimaris]
MNIDIAEGKWKQLKGEVKDRWGKLTDDELNQVEGRSERLVGLLQERYGLEREQAEKEIEFLLH